MNIKLSIRLLVILAAFGGANVFADHLADEPVHAKSSLLKIKGDGITFLDFKNHHQYASPAEPHKVTWEEIIHLQLMHDALKLSQKGIQMSLEMLDVDSNIRYVGLANGFGRDAFLLVDPGELVEEKLGMVNFDEVLPLSPGQLVQEKVGSPGKLVEEKVGSPGKLVEEKVGSPGKLVEKSLGLDDSGNLVEEKVGNPGK